MIRPGIRLAATLLLRGASAPAHAQLTAGEERLVANDRGILVKAGDEVRVSTFNAVAGERLDALRETVERGETLAAETTTSLAPVIAVIFAQSGLRLGATLEGAKYTRIIP